MKKTRTTVVNDGGRWLLGLLLLVTIAVLCVPDWLRQAPLPPPAALADHGELYLPMLLADLSQRGCLHPDAHAAAAFVGDAGSIPFLEYNGITLDGIAAVLPALEAPLQQLPENYKVVYTHDATAFAVKKIASSIGAALPQRRRRLLSVPEAKKMEALNGLEGVLLEPPFKRRSMRRLLRPKYLPELTGDSLEGYRRRVFIDVTQLGSVSIAESAASWFSKYYPRGNREFEIMRLQEVEAKEVPLGTKQQGLGEWLEGHVREEDYAVVKAGAAAVEEMARRGTALRLVDELFLECSAQGAEETVGRPYWECLALYGRLRDQGVAVHQWWGSFK